MNDEFGRVASSRHSDQSPACPDQERWNWFAAKLLSNSESSNMLNHVANCSHCSSLLHAAMNDIGTELSSEEVSILRSLLTAGNRGQRALATRMAEVARPASHTPIRTRSRRWRPFALAMLSAAAVATATAIAFWTFQARALSHTDHLISDAYSKHRPFAMRLSGVAYGPVREVLGTGTSRLDQADLVDAEDEVADELKRHPSDKRWQYADAQTALLEKHAARAISILEPLTRNGSPKPAVRIDLAVAYIQLGDADSSQSESNYKHALALLDAALHADPNSDVASFNRALVLERLERPQEAIAAWNRYLSLDPNSPWAEEVRREHLKASH